MTKVPTIYDIGNFSLDWNNVEILDPSTDFNIIKPVQKSGMIVTHTSNSSGTYHTNIYSFNKSLKEYIETSGFFTAMNDPSSVYTNTGGSHDQNYPLHLNLVVTKGDYYYIESDGSVVRLACFIPFKNQPVTPPAGCVSYVVETGHNPDNTAFYRKYSDGYIEQWGYSSYESKSEGQISVTYATPFSSNVNFPTITPVGDNGTDMEAYVFPNSVNSTGFSWYANHDSYVATKKTEQPGLFTNLKGAYWHACGY